MGDVTLRPFEERDIETYRGWINSPQTMVLLGRTLPVSDIEHKAWCEELLTDGNSVVFAIESADYGYTGNIWLCDVDWLHRKAEIRVLVGDGEHRGKGIGTEALREMTAFAFNRLDLYRVYAFVLGYNDPARRAFEGAGYRMEGTLRGDRFLRGGRVDVFLLSALRNDTNDKGERLW